MHSVSTVGGIDQDPPPSYLDCRRHDADGDDDDDHADNEAAVGRDFLGFHTAGLITSTDPEPLRVPFAPTCTSTTFRPPRPSDTATRNSDTDSTDDDEGQELHSIAPSESAGSLSQDNASTCSHYAINAPSFTNLPPGTPFVSADIRPEVRSVACNQAETTCISSSVAERPSGDFEFQPALLPTSTSRRSFLSSLLHRSASQSGSRRLVQALPSTSHHAVRSSSVNSNMSEGRTSAHQSPSAASPSAFANRLSASSSVSSLHQHRRHNSTPPSPCPTDGSNDAFARRNLNNLGNAGPVTRTGANIGLGLVAAPPANDGVFSRPLQDQEASSSFAEMQNMPDSPSNRTSRIFSISTPMRASTSMASTVSSWLSPRQGSLMTTSTSTSGISTVSSVTTSPVIGTGNLAANAGTNTLFRSNTQNSHTQKMSDTKGKRAASSCLPSEPDTSSLESLGLELSQLTPALPLSRHGQPTCGAVLDGRYLLIGTTTGLDFVPLNRAGNRSLKNGILERLNLAPQSAPSSLPSAAKEKDLRVRKPISLIKKTRFKQLVILDERSNVMLAVAGRNDHVRVYALDALRTLIQRKMREIDEKDRYVPSSPRPDKSAEPTSVSMALKGKGRAQGAPPPLSLNSSSARSPMPRDKAAQPVPPPDYAFPAATSAPDLHTLINEGTYLSLDTAGDVHQRRSSVISMPSTPSYARTRRSSSHATITADSSRATAAKTSPLPSPSHLVSESISRTLFHEHALASSSARRGSATPTSRTSSSANLGRRPSTATITSSTVSALATSAALPTETDSSQDNLVIRRKGSSSFVPDGVLGAPTTSESRRRGSIGVLEYNSASPISAMLSLTSTDEPVPPVPETFRQTASSSAVNAMPDDITSTGAHARNGADSTTLNVRSKRSRLLPRSPIAQIEVMEESEADEATGNTLAEVTTSASKLVRTSNRMSFVEALHELPEPSVASSRALLPPTAPRTTARLVAKEPHRSPRDDFAEALASFFREEDSPGQPRSPNVRSLEARSPLVQPDADSETEGPSIIDIMRAGPPQPLPITIDGSGSASSDISGSDDASHVLSPDPIDSVAQQLTSERRGHRKLSKASSRRKSSTTIRATMLAHSASTEIIPHGDSRSLRGAQAVPSDSSAPTSPEISSAPANLPVPAANPNRRSCLLPRSPVVRSESQHFEDAASPGGSDSVPSVSLQDVLATSAPHKGSHTAQDRSSTMNCPSLSPAPSAQLTTPESRKRWSLFGSIRPNSPAITTGSGAHARQPSLNTTTQTTDIASQAQQCISDTLETLGLAPPSPSARPEPRYRTTSSTSVRSRDICTSVNKRRNDREADDEPRSRRNLDPHFQNLCSGEADDPEGTTVTLTQRRRHDSTTLQDRMSQVADALNGTSYGDGNSVSLEYVKLARTKGSRFIRASETKKRTYLAVLCGENGERVELFTGSKNVSLSLNRTFVLPETPRTIELQIQGEDLLDLYLIYDSAVFALEPSTVRVREVAIHRNERRQARREQARSIGDATTMATQPAHLPAEINDVLSNDGRLRTHSRTPSSAAFTGGEARGSAQPSAIESAASATAPTAQSGPESAKDRELPVVPFTTFQQLEYLPTFPASVLSISYIIPPTYETVLSASPATRQGAFAASVSGQAELQNVHNAMHTDVTAAPPLLSPVSLLSNPTARTAGPPGLFFVTKGDRTTNIVDGDGRSIMKQPIDWKASEAQLDKLMTILDVFTRMEILVTDERRRVCVIGFGPANIKLFELGMTQPNVIEIVPQEASKRRMKANTSLNIALSGRDGEEFYVRDVSYLTKFGEICFFSERMGNDVAIYALSAAGHLQSLRR